MKEFGKEEWSVTSDIDFGKDFERLRAILHKQLSCLKAELIRQIMQIACKISLKRKAIMEKLRRELSQIMRLTELREIAFKNEREDEL